MNIGHKPIVLLVENRISLARCYTEFLSNEQCEIIHASFGETAKLMILDSRPSVVLLDLHLPDVEGLSLLEFTLKNHPDSSVVVITAQGSIELSRKVIELGATDYLEKPFTRDRLCLTVKNAIKKQQLASSKAYSKGFSGFIGSSIIMQGVYHIIEKAASSQASVFITGESGTGKEVCAQAIHMNSSVSHKPLVTLNCAAIPKDLMESEIFGHVKGAFTGAVHAREGAASKADGGTLFLDEIGEMSLELQSKLLRFIQTGQFQKVGSSTTEMVKIRFICATNRNPLEQIRQGKFREDLYYRLHVIPIYLPPLRERGDDVLKIAEHFLKIYAEEENKKFIGLSPDVCDFFLRYPWPGNVRQLLNTLRNIVVMHNAELVLPYMLPESLSNIQVDPELSEYGSTPSVATESDHTQYESPRAVSAQPDGARVVPSRSPLEETDFSLAVDDMALDPDQIKPLWEVQLKAIEEAIRLCNGSVAQAAKRLEISPSTIYRKLPVKNK